MVDKMDQLGIFHNEEIKPLAYRARPTKLEDFVGQTFSIRIIQKMIEKKKLVNMLIYGPSGCGKTTLSKIIAKEMNYNFEYLNAIKCGVSSIKEVSKRAKDYMAATGKKTILLFDEIHRFNKAQQDSLLQDIEEGEIILIGATTENPYYTLNKAIISRCIVLKFEKLKDEDIRKILKEVCDKFSINIDEEVTKYILSIADGDARTALNVLELIEQTDLEMVKNGINIQQRYDASDKYDRISALIKSIRGSDENAAVYWLATMLDAGEDIKYIARRLVISASEDVGLANVQALNVAVSTMKAIEEIGMPEARIILAECVIYLALSPKSNSAYKAINKALEHIRENGVQKVPVHLTKLGSNKYIYPHDYTNHYIKQKYMEKYIKFYNSADNKFEKKLKDFWDKIKEEN